LSHCINVEELDDELDIDELLLELLELDLLELELDDELTSHPGLKRRFSEGDTSPLSESERKQRSLIMAMYVYSGIGFNI